MLHMFSCNSFQRFQTISFVIYREITFFGKITEIWILSKWAVGDKYKYVATITMLRVTMHACFSILASIVWEKLIGNWSDKTISFKIVNEKFHSPPPPSIFWFLRVIWKSHDKTRLIPDLYDFPPHTLTNFQTISLIIHREIAFLGKITKIWIMSKLEDSEKIQILCHHLYA